MIDVTYRSSVALLIDAENIHDHSAIEDALRLSAYFGELLVRDAYADWNEQPTSKTRYEDLDVNCQQVEHLVKKDDVDDRIKIDIGRFLVDSSALPHIDIFILVSGDKGFSTTYEAIQKEDKKLIIIGKQGSNEVLQKSCDKFYFLHELKDELQKLETQYPIHPKILRQVFKHLELMFIGNFEDPYSGKNYSVVEKELHEKLSNSPVHLENYQLSECLKYFGEKFEQSGDRIIINPHFLRRMALSMAYTDARQANNSVSLASFGNFLRESSNKFSPEFYKTYFHDKKLSQWLAMYSEMFEIDENIITLAPNYARPN